MKRPFLTLFLLLTTLPFCSLDQPVSIPSTIGHSATTTALTLNPSTHSGVCHSDLGVMENSVGFPLFISKQTEFLQLSIPSSKNLIMHPCDSGHLSPSPPNRARSAATKALVKSSNWVREATPRRSRLETAWVSNGSAARAGTVVSRIAGISRP